MTILNIAYPFAPVNENSAGGAEQILYSLDSAMYNSPFQSIVLACKGSYSQNILIETIGELKTISGNIKNNVYSLYKNLIEKTLQEYKIDLIHFHGIDFNNYIPVTDIPMLVTLHLPIDFYNFQGVSTEEVYFNSVSKTQNASAPGQIKILKVIENGITVNKFSFSKKKKDYALCLGGICREKGFIHAIHAARLAGIPLIIAGEIFPYQDHINYFETRIKPLLDQQITYVASINLKEKIKFLSQAKCLLVTSLVQETSSLVLMEAMASGTPVVAFKAGALPEIVKDGITGYIVNDEAEMANAINMVHLINPEDCRQLVIEKYSSERMVNEYFDLYTRIINKQILTRQISLEN